jgi:hypothetical protein
MEGTCEIWQGVKIKFYGWESSSMLKGRFLGLGFVSMKGIVIQRHISGIMTLFFRIRLYEWGIIFEI